MQPLLQELQVLFILAIRYPFRQILVIFKTEFFRFLNYCHLCRFFLDKNIINIIIPYLASLIYSSVSRDGYSQWRKLVWSPDCSFVVVAYGNGVVSFFDLTASNLFNIAAVSILL